MIAQSLHHANNATLVNNKSLSINNNVIQLVMLQVSQLREEEEKASKHFIKKILEQEEALRVQQTKEDEILARKLSEELRQVRKGMTQTCYKSTRIVLLGGCLLIVSPNTSRAIKSRNHFV